MEDIESSYRRWVQDLWNAESFVIIDELFAEDGIAYYPFFLQSDEPIRGREEFKQFVIQIKAKFCEIVSEISEITSENSRVTALCKITGKLRNSDKNESQTTEIIATKGLCRIEFKDGKIVKIWNNIFSDLADYEKLTYLIQNP